MQPYLAWDSLDVADDNSVSADLDDLIAVENLLDNSSLCCLDWIVSSVKKLEMHIACLSLH